MGGTPGEPVDGVTSCDKSPTVWKSCMTKNLSYKLKTGSLFWFLPKTHCDSGQSLDSPWPLFSDRCNVHAGLWGAVGRWEVEELEHILCSLLQAASRETRWRLRRTSSTIPCLRRDGWHLTSTNDMSGCESQKLLDLLITLTEV